MCFTIVHLLIQPIKRSLTTCVCKNFFSAGHGSCRETAFAAPTEFLPDLQLTCSWPTSISNCI